MPVELDALRKEAESVAHDAVARRGRHADSWINGYDRELSHELAARGWIGMTWPPEHGGGGRTSLERFVVTATRANPVNYDEKRQSREPSKAIGLHRASIAFPMAAAS